MAKHYLLTLFLIGILNICLIHAQECFHNLLPVYAGGSGEEKVNCFQFDPINQLFIVGGLTRSGEDFAPTEDDHGFLYAIDYFGNWQWGKYF